MPDEGGTSVQVDYLLHLADNALILGQRNAQWCGHGPVLEEDIAMANISLDLIGQARFLYQHAAETLADGSTEDTLAYFRDPHEFRNYTLLELPHISRDGVHHTAPANAPRDYATTIARNFLYSVWMQLLWSALGHSSDAQLAAIAARATKEVSYHLRHSRYWLVRLGDGTEESHRRTQAALDHLMPFTEEFWTPSPTEVQAHKDGLCPDVATLKQAWSERIGQALAEATLQDPAPIGLRPPMGKIGVHSEYLMDLLQEMQSLARAHPEAVW